MFCWTVISHVYQSFSPFSSTAVGALGLFTFLPQCTVHNMRRTFLYIVPCMGALDWVCFCLHSSQSVLYTICVYLTWAFLVYIFVGFDSTTNQTNRDYYFIYFDRKDITKDFERDVRREGIIDFFPRKKIAKEGAQFASLNMVR